MTFQYGATLRTARLTAIITAIGASGTCKIFSGAEPANCAASDPSGTLGTITLPSTPLTASAGVTALSGTWSTTASASGTAASFRIYASDGTTCVIQGNVTTDLVLNNTSITSGQPISVTSFAITAAGA